MSHFWVQNGSFAPNKHFLGKILNIILIYLSINFIVSNFKILRPRVKRMCDFWTQNGPICPNQNVIYSLSTFQKSKSDMNLLKKYWRLKNTEITLTESLFLAIITWEPDFSQVFSFWRMLKDHKNFRFTTVLDNTKDLIFVKCPKTLFFDAFWPFLTSFFSKISWCHI